MERALKVLMLDPSGSSVQVTHNLSNALVAQGCKVAVFTAPYWLKSVEHCSRHYDLHVHFSRRTQSRAYESRSWGARFFWRALRLVEHCRDMAKVVRCSHDFDVVHTQILTLPTIDWLFLCLIARKVPLAHTVHDLFPHDSHWRRIKKLVLKQIYAGAAVLFVHTISTQEGLIREFGIPPEKIIRIRHGSLAHLLELRVNNEPSNDAVILFLGKIRADKGLDVLLEAALILRNRGIDFKMLVAGSPAMDMKSVERFISEKGLSPFMELRFGYLEEPELVGYFSRAAVVALPYREVAQSGVAIGACTMGKAIVASAIGGLRELVEEAGNGRLVTVDDPQQLAEAIAELLINPELRQQMEANSRAYAAKQLSWPPIASTTIAAYKRIACGK